ncbi:MAG: putative Peptidoglycan domain [Bacteroidetes bacterium]|nr:putative Peptidoglycan domain [Bacteroidota bacterium]
MKKLILTLLFVPIMLTAQVRRDSVEILRDSICKLNQRPAMTSKQFIEIYKYETLLKYYRLCQKKPTNWKFYKGWSARVFDK